MRTKNQLIYSHTKLFNCIERGIIFIFYEISSIVKRNEIKLKNSGQGYVREKISYKSHEQEKLTFHT